MKTITVCKWYVKLAIYLEDELIIYEDLPHLCPSLFEKLGYKVVQLKEIDTHNKVKELNWDHHGWWVPPNTLKELVKQLGLRRKREQQERIGSLKEELTRLEKEFNAEGQ